MPVALSEQLCCYTVEHTKARSFFYLVPYGLGEEMHLLIFVSALWGSSPHFLCSQGAEVAIGELEIHKQGLTSLKSMEGPMGVCIIACCGD